MVAIKRARRMAIDDEIKYREVGTRDKCAHQTAVLPRLDVERWPLMPFDTRLVWLTSWADAREWIRTGQKAPGWGSLAAADFVALIDRVRLDENGGDGGKYLHVAAGLFNASGALVKLEAINTAVETYFTSARLLSSYRRTEAMGEQSRCYLEEQHAKAADMLDALEIGPTADT